ncbi:MAG: type II toxin-antitoxin system VapC family toxin [Thermoplasmata archaeon]
MGVALDSTLFVDLARRRPSALRKIEELDSRRELKVIPTPVAYEVLSGILQTKSRTQAALFRGWISKFHIAGLDLNGAERAAAIRVELSHLGRVKGTGDILTAGIALAGGHSLVTRDTDFRAIAEVTGQVLEPY